jgi:N-acetylmuramoyl-L-alanine amidase
MKRILFTAAVFIVLTALLSPATQGNDPETVDPERTLGVVYGDGRTTEDVPLFRLARPSEELFISAYDLARIFRATRYWNAGARKLVLRIESHSFMFTIDTRVVVVDDEPILMRIPVSYANGSVMIPLEFLPEILAPLTIEEVELDEETFVLTIGSPQYNITGVDFEDEGEDSRAVLTLTEELLYHVDSETPGLLRLKVYGGRLNALKINATEGRGLFNRVRAEQTEHDSYLFFDVAKTAESFRVEFIGSGDDEDRGRKLVIHLEKGELPEIPEVDFAGRRMTEILDDSRAIGRRDIVRVAIDAGHGGIDKGKIGPTGVMEKEVNLDIAMRLRDILVSDYDMEVILTRTEDVLVPLMRRAEIANSQEADIFISLHCNGWFHPDAGGYETFFLSQAKTEESARLAMEENASIQFEGPGVSAEELDDLGFMLWDMVQNEFVTESSELAELIQRELGEVVDIRNRGVKQAGLIVLKGCRMPAVLVEVAFLSNPEEEKLLADRRFREEVARGIAEAISRYRAKNSTAVSQ